MATEKAMAKKWVAIPPFKPASLVPPLQVFVFPKNSLMQLENDNKGTKSTNSLICLDPHKEQ